MRSKLFVVASCLILSGVCTARASAQGVQVHVGQPGAYEIHEFVHRPTSFDRAPYFATNAPVYYGPLRVERSYGWTPYPYLGTSYQQPIAPKPQAVQARDTSDRWSGSLLPAKKDKKEKKKLKGAESTLMDRPASSLR